MSRNCLLLRTCSASQLMASQPFGGSRALQPISSGGAVGSQKWIRVSVLDAAVPARSARSMLSGSLAWLNMTQRLSSLGACRQQRLRLCRSLKWPLTMAPV